MIVRHVKSGEYSPLDGSTVCTSCVAGKYLSDTGASGSATSHDAEVDCVICSYGKYSGIKSQSCTNCEVGRYLSDDVQNEANHDSILDCIICGKAKYAHQEGMQACVNCIAGTYFILYILWLKSKVIIIVLLLMENNMLNTQSRE